MDKLDRVRWYTFGPVFPMDRGKGNRGDERSKSTSCTFEKPCLERGVR